MARSASHCSQTAIPRAVESISCAVLIVAAGLHTSKTFGEFRIRAAVTNPACVGLDATESTFVRPGESAGHGALDGSTGDDYLNMSGEMSGGLLFAAGLLYLCSISFGEGV